MNASVYVATSLDGFIARANGDIDFLPGGGGEDAEEDYGYKDFIETVDALVMGRHTFEKVLTFGEWPYGSKRVFILRSEQVEVPQEIASSVESISCPPGELVTLLSGRGVKHLYIDGGKTIQRFLEAGLIQQLIITRIPILIGSSIPLFGPLRIDIRLRHVETRQFESRLVQSKYEVAAPAA